MSDIITQGLGGTGDIITQGLGGTGGTGGTIVSGATLFIGTELPDSGTMIGNTIVLRRQEIGDQIFNAPTATVSVMLGGGTFIESVAATVVPAGPVTTYVLQAFLTEATAGDYEAQWTVLANGQTLLRKELHFVFWSDVRAYVRRLLRVDSVMVTDSDIDMAARSSLASMLAIDEFGAYLSSYSTVLSTERAVFDQALALIIAAWMRPFTPKQGAVGELIGLAIGPDEYKWMPTVRPQDMLSIEEAWLNRALDLLGSMPSFAGAFAWQNAMVGFVASGRRRNTASPLIVGPFGVYNNPLYTAWGEWIGLGSGFGWSWGGSTPWGSRW